MLRHVINTMNAKNIIHSDNMNRFLCLMFVCVALMGCSTQSITVLSVDATKMAGLQVTDFYKTVSVVVLETDSAAPMLDVSAVQFRSDSLFLLDKVTQTLNLFNTEGTLIHRMENRGNGHGEYINASSFKVDDKGIYVSDFSTDKILCYDLDFNFVKSLSLPVAPMESDKVGDVFLVFSIPDKKQMDDCLRIFDEDGKELGGFLREQTSSGDYNWLTSNGLCPGTPYYVSLTDAWTFWRYSAEDKDLDECFEIDFGKYLPKHQNEKDIVSDSYSHQYVSRGKVFQNHTHLFVEYFLNRQKRYLVIPHNLPENFLQGSVETNDLVPGFRFWIRASSDNKGLDYIDASSLLQDFPEVAGHFERLKNLKPDDGLVLFIYE